MTGLLLGREETEKIKGLCSLLSSHSNHFAAKQGLKEILGIIESAEAYALAKKERKLEKRWIKLALK